MKTNASEWHELGAWHAYALGPEFWMGPRFCGEWLAQYGWRPRTLCFFDGEKNHQYIDAQSVKKLETLFQPRFFKKMLADFKKNKEKIISLNAQPTIEFLEEKVYQPYARNAVFDWTAFLYEQLKHDEILSHFKGSALEFAELTTPLIETATLREQRTLLESALQVKKGGNARALAEKLARNYGFTPVFHMNEPHDATHYEHELQKTSERSAAELESELKIASNAIAKIKEAQTALEKTLSLELKQKILALRTCAEIRTESDEIVSRVGMLFRQVLLPIARKRGVTYKDVFFLKTSELHAIDKRKIEERKKFFSAHTLDDEWIIETSEKARETAAPLLKKVETIQTSELKGIPSSAGSARGRVRVVTNPINASLEEGEILVAPQTTVDYVPLMRKAAAIVTDHGGLTSHAAIVAREFKTPCVVGTKTASKTLKDGDKVEVNANTGVVKLVK